MCASVPEQTTYPHDYRLICESDPAPIIVGGQAINLWAISFLQPGAPDLASKVYGSKDLDILANTKVLAYLKKLPGWVYKPQSFRNWMDTRVATLHGMTRDGRKLLVEVLHSVHGLEAQDLKTAEYVRQGGGVYRVLDPIVMMKAKAANLRDLDQAGPPPRQDRHHLQLISRCVPLYLREVHQIAVETRDPAAEKQAVRTLNRAFKILQDPKTAGTLSGEQISSAALVPEEFAQSPLERIRRSIEYQMPILEIQQRGRGPGLQP